MTSSDFLFRKTLVEPLGSSLYEFPYEFADRAWPLLLKERNDPYETVSVRIGDTALNNKKAHVSRVIDLFDQTVLHVGTAHVRSNTLVTVRVHKTTGTAPNQQPMQLLTQPRSFQFNTRCGDVEVSKILLSHDPLELHAAVVIDDRFRQGPVPLRELRNAYEGALLQFRESERHRLMLPDAIRSHELRTVPVVVSVTERTASSIGSSLASAATSHDIVSRDYALTPPERASPTTTFAERQQQQKQQQQHLQYQDAMRSQKQAPHDSGSPVLLPGSSGGHIYPITTPTSTMYSPQQSQDHPQRLQHQQFMGSAQEKQQRRKDQPPAPLLDPGLGRTSMYFETGQYGGGAEGSAPSLPPDFFVNV